MILTLKDLFDNQIIGLSDYFVIKNKENEIIFDNRKVENTELVLDYSLNSYKVERIYSTCNKTDYMVIRTRLISLK